jgi:hypothetical protein
LQCHQQFFLAYIEACLFSNVLIFFRSGVVFVFSPSDHHHHYHPPPPAAADISSYCFKQI